jgi:hypothetical protein
VSAIAGLIYDGSAQTTAAGTATGVSGALPSSDFHLAGTVHTNAGTYNGDPWSFSDPSGNYAPASGTVNDSIAQLRITVTAVTNTKVYDGTTSAAARPTVSPGLVGTDTSAFIETYSSKTVGTWPLTASGSVNDGNGGNNYSVVLWQSATGTITTPAVAMKVIDDASTAFQTSGTWKTATSSLDYLGSDHVAVSAGASATWTFSGLTVGAQYTVYGTWPGGGPTNVPYTVTTNGVPAAVPGVSQSAAPSTSVANSGPTGATPWKWTELGSSVYTIGADGKLVVGISNSGASSAAVAADAVMIQLYQPLQPQLATGGVGSTPSATPVAASAAQQAQATDAVVAALAQPQSGSSSSTTAALTSAALSLLYGAE